MKKCTRCKQEHNDDTQMCPSCKKYNRDINRKMNPKIKERYKDHEEDGQYYIDLLEKQARL